jgi:hypothetical protein
MPDFTVRQFEATPMSLPVYIKIQGLGEGDLFFIAEPGAFGADELAAG